jgi:hypothetical protein
MPIPIKNTGNFGGVPNPQDSQENVNPEFNSHGANQQDPPSDSEKQNANAANTATTDTQNDNLKNKAADVRLTSVPNPIDNPETLPSVIVDVPGNPNVKEPSLPIIGFNLSSFVLSIIAGFIILLVIFLFVKEFDATSSIKIPTEANISDSTYAKKIELIKLIQEEKKSYRDFTIQISQMILLNLLLPVLTAILGYIFASNKNKES